MQRGHPAATATGRPSSSARWTRVGLRTGRLLDLPQPGQYADGFAQRLRHRRGRFMGRIMVEA